MINKHMIHFTYKILHPNGKYYVGRHSTNNINDGYMGSGKWPRSIKDKSILKKEIILFYRDFDLLKDAERRLLQEHVGNPDCMNFNNNPIGFAYGDLNPAKSDKEKKRKSLLIGSLNPMYGKQHTVAASLKMSNSRLGKPTWNKGKSGIKTSNKGTPAWNKGLKTGHQSFTDKKHSLASIELMKAKHANREKIQCLHCNRTIDKPNYTRYHGDKCKSKHWHPPCQTLSIL